MRQVAFGPYRVIIALLLVFGVLVVDAGQASAEVDQQAGVFYWVSHSSGFRNVFAQARMDSVKVPMRGRGTASGRVAIWNANGECAYVQYKPAFGGVFHHRSEKVCSGRLGRWVSFRWSDDFMLYNSGAYSFRLCIADRLRDTCTDAITIEIPVG